VKKRCCRHLAPDRACIWTPCALSVARQTRPTQRHGAWTLALHGSSALAVLAARLTLRFSQGMADFSPGVSPWMRGLAGAAHAALYGTLLALPLLG